MLRPAWWPMSRLLSLSLSRYSSRALQCRTAIVVPSAVEDKDQASSWQQLQLAPALCSRLQQAGYARPNSLQAQWLPQLMQATGQPLVLGAETGTGKTLCYLLPILDRLLQPKDAATVPPPSPQSKAAALVVLPNKNLLAQVTRVAQTIAEPLGVKTAVLSVKDKVEPVAQGVHIVFTTASTLSQVDYTPLQGHCQVLVLDEFDSFFVDDGLATSTLRVLKTLSPASIRQPKVRPFRTDLFPSAQILMVGATLPDRGKRSVMELLQHKLPNLEVIKTTRLHRPVPQLRQHFHELRGTATPEGLRHAKNHAVVDLLQDERNARRSILIFCNSVHSADEMGHTLLARGFKVGIIHKNIPMSTREKYLQQLESKAIQVIVCTDMLGRGMDLNVDMVICADFPRDFGTYVHRIGRTARNDRPGVVHLLVDPEGPSYRLASDIQRAHELTNEEWLSLMASLPEQNALDAHEAPEASEAEMPDIYRQLFSRNRSLRKRYKRQGAVLTTGVAKLMEKKKEAAASDTDSR